LLAVRASMRFAPPELIEEHEAAIAAGTSIFHQDLRRAIEEAGEFRHRIAS
jgi:hypothetical protein